MKSKVFLGATISSVSSKLLQAFVASFEIFFNRRHSCPPIFILGAPRCGSTLLIQALTEAFDIGYVSNCHCKWYGAPCLAESLLKPLLNRPASSFSSKHGTTDGSYSPAECGQYWYRFFRHKPAYVPITNISKTKLSRFQRSVNAFIYAVGKPVVFKNLYAGLRLQPILKAFPNSLFIIIKRDEIDNAHSILEGRFETFRSYDRWWSVEPPNVEELKKLPAYQQVVEQIRSIYHLVEADLSLMKVKKDQIMRVSYEDFCINPGREIDSLDLFFRRNGLDITRRAGLPNSFPMRRREIRIDPAVYQSMADYSKIRSSSYLSS